MDGEDGLHLARAEKPDLIVLDLLMPRLNGFETMDHLRHDSITCSIPIVVLTEVDLSAEDRARLEGQISGIFSKHPRAREDFVETLQDLVERHTERHASGLRVD